MFAIFCEIVQSVAYTIIVTGGNTSDELSFFFFFFLFVLFVWACKLHYHGKSQFVVVVIPYNNNNKNVVHLVWNRGGKGGWKIQILTLVTAFIVAGVTEEVAKGIVLQHCTKLYLPNPVYLNGSYINTFVWMGLAAGLGFGTMEGILYTCLYGISSGFLGQLIIGSIRVFLAIPFHTLTGVMWPYFSFFLECLQQEKTWIQMGIKQVLWHGLYDYIEMEYSLFAPANDLLLSLLGLVLGYIIVIIAAIVTRRDYQNLLSNQFATLRNDTVEAEEMTSFP
ncbi:hypothetical protein RFI_11065 [Reticulomyxa filosa]|uniref:Uncharacterized protein n=1 Tax=Reticulomyxa filosa TaxID=46433 RepID=X6NJ88_RETFI|nr:hypothetical protein RFI_11065 [Reticulomyxa filosa]|eukprot:ETO26071.1 hypothetical protein RFI_11065 [Reticulomyxa filosa]